jgi:hypothetical protein
MEKGRGENKLKSSTRIEEEMEWQFDRISENKKMNYV